MTRSELIRSLAARAPQLTLADVDVAVKVLIDAICETLVCRNRVEIRGFGTFGLTYRPGRTGRNPKTGEKVAVPGKWVPHFKAGKELRDRVMESALPPEPLKKAA